jgi:hypothetical protein
VQARSCSSLWALFVYSLIAHASQGDEMEGLDVTQHGEEAYIHDSGFSTAIRVEASKDIPELIGVTAPSL